MAHGLLFPQPGIEPLHPLHLQNVPNHWTTNQGSPSLSLLTCVYSCQLLFLPVYTIGEFITWPINVLGFLGSPLPYLRTFIDTSISLMYFYDLKVTRSAQLIRFRFSPCVTNKICQEMALWVNFSPRICAMVSPRTQVNYPKTKLS